MMKLRSSKINKNFSASAHTKMPKAILVKRINTINRGKAKGNPNTATNEKLLLAFHAMALVMVNIDENPMLPNKIVK